MEEEQKIMDRLAELDAKFNTDIILTDDERKEYQELDEILYILRYNRLHDSFAGIREIIYSKRDDNGAPK